jgi:hypothetical protein
MSWLLIKTAPRDGTRFLVNLRRDAEFGPEGNFDNRMYGTTY